MSSEDDGESFASSEDDDASITGKIYQIKKNFWPDRIRMMAMVLRMKKLVKMAYIWHSNGAI